MLPINQNQPLFALLGTTYGGDGQVNFALPNLQGRVPIHMGSGHTLGERGGEQAHTLSISETADACPHRERFDRTIGDTPIASATAVARLLRQSRCTPRRPISRRSIPSTLASIGGSQAHPNMQPFLVLNFSIALQGIFPSQN